MLPSVAGFLLPHTESRRTMSSRYFYSTYHGISQKHQVPWPKVPWFRGKNGTYRHFREAG